MIALIWCPFPDHDSARSAIHAMLDENLIACANIIGAVESHFVWNGQREIAQETGILLKTSADRLNQAIERLGTLHPYDTPAIAGWCCDACHPATDSWIGSLGALS